MAALRAEIAKQGGELRGEVYGATRQMYMALLAQATVLLAFFLFLRASTTVVRYLGCCDCNR